MAEFKAHKYEETIVLHFGGDAKRINAYTLASALVGFADAIKSANALINPGYEVEVVVEAVGPGSFKALIRTIYHASSNLFSKEDLRAIVLGVIASTIHQHTFAPDSNIVVTVNDSEVVIENGIDRVVVPRNTYEAMKQVEKSEEFQDGVGRAFNAIEKDKEITTFGVSPTMEDPTPDIPIPRSRFPLLQSFGHVSEGQIREINEITDLQITRAILERSRKRWQFVWRGVRISAPVVDTIFYNSFFAREITIAPGDMLKVRLKMVQRCDPDTGIWINDTNGYEVLEVIDHLPRATQTAYKM